MQTISQEQNDETIKNIIQFYTNKWKNTPKPFKHNEYFAKKKQLPLDSVAMRYINEQSTVFIANNGEKRANKRKLHELPYLIAKLNPEAAVLNGAEHFVFDYQFLYYLFLTTEQNIIMDSIQGITKHVKNTKNTKIRKIGYQIQLFTLIFIAINQALKKYPENFGVILTSRLLIFYKLFKYFKKLIDEADKFSPSDCALVAPYQYLMPPGGGQMLSIDSHNSEIKTTLLDNSFLVTCSDCINFFLLQKLRSIGEQKYPVITNSSNQIESVKITRVFFVTVPRYDDEMLNDFDGGYIIMSQSTITSIKFDKSIYFTKKFSDAELINIFLLPDKYLLVQFLNKKYFDIYNIFTGETVVRKTLNSVIKRINCSINNEYIIKLMSIYGASELIVCLEKGEIQKFLFNTNLELMYKIPPGGIECYDCAFKMVVKNDGDLSCIDARFYIVTFDDGAILSINDKKNEKNEYNWTATYLFPKTTKPEQYRVSIYGLDLLLISKSGNIYFLHNNKEDKFRMIPGQFQFAQIARSGFLAASSFGNISVFYVKKLADVEENKHKLFSYVKFDAHYDDIVYFEYQGKKIINSLPPYTFKSKT